MFPAQSQTIFGKGITLNQFLPDDKYHEVLEFALNHAPKFQSSQTVTQAENYRQSSLIFSYDFPEIYEWMKVRLLKHFSRICQQLNLAYFPITQIEMQMTAHNDGNFYKIHNDSGSDITNTRTLTYVYYFYQEPKQFSGGELQLYDTVFSNHHPIAQTPNQLIQPENNSLVFFPSICQHEVLPVRCASQQFQHSRFTLNGWFHN